jgi:hypothetical protein
MSKQAAAGTKYRMSLGLPVGAVMNCADNSGAKSGYPKNLRAVGTISLVKFSLAQSSDVGDGWTDGDGGEKIARRHARACAR